MKLATRYAPQMQATTSFCVTSDCARAMRCPALKSRARIQPRNSNLFRGLGQLYKVAYSSVLGLSYAMSGTEISDAHICYAMSGTEMVGSATRSSDDSSGSGSGELNHSDIDKTFVLSAECGHADVYGGNVLVFMAAMLVFAGAGRKAKLPLWVASYALAMRCTVLLSRRVLSYYALAMRCPVLRSGMLLPACAWPTTRTRRSYLGTKLRYLPTRCACVCCYAVPGTDLAYAATSLAVLSEELKDSTLAAKLYVAASYADPSMADAYNNLGMLSAYALAMRCPVLTQYTVLRAYHAVPSTGVSKEPSISYQKRSHSSRSGICLRACYAMYGTDLACAAIFLRFFLREVRYGRGAYGLHACCSTDVACSATRFLRDVRYRQSIRGYQLAVQASPRNPNYYLNLG
eukprot:3933644-Rhodomonas_salina.3